MNIPEYDGIGIYRLLNPENGKCYVGAAINVNKRVKQHVRALKSKKVNKKMMLDILNWEYWVCEILEFLPYGLNRLQIAEREVEYIQEHDSIVNGYNYSIPNLTTKETLGYCTSTTERHEMAIEEPANNTTSKIESLNIPISKPEKNMLKTFCKENNETISGYIRRLINEDMGKLLNCQPGDIMEYVPGE